LLVLARLGNPHTVIRALERDKAAAAAL